jgi:N-acetylmuramoyl-L-alanine amidase
MAKRSSTQLIVIHCTATRPSMDIGRVEVDAWHRHRGFLGIGYHYVIRQDGLLEEGRDSEQIGAHARGFNAISISIAMVGGVTEEDVTISEDNFKDEQWVTLKALVERLMELYPEAEVLGHRDLPNVLKDCPAFDVKTWMTAQNI